VYNFLSRNLTTGVYTLVPRQCRVEYRNKADPTLFTIKFHSFKRHDVEWWISRKL